MRQTKPTLVGHLGRVSENNEREMGESKSKQKKKGRRKKTTTSESPIQAEANSQETKYPAKDCSSQFQRTIQDAKMWQMQDAYAYANAYAGSKQCSNAHMADRHQTKNFKDGVVHVVNLTT